MTDKPARARPRRIASDEAHSWARNLRLRNPHAKYVLCMLTLYVNGDGSCFVGVPVLADDCELAIETVRKRLGFLEQVGAIARFAQWLDEHGRRNSEGRGKRTSDDIRLLIDADIEAIEARAADRNSPTTDGTDEDISPPRDRGLNSEVSPPHGGGTNEGEESASPPTRSLVGLCQDSSCVGGLIPEPEPEPEPESSPYPLHDPLGGLRPFADRYPIPISDIEATRMLWSALTSAEQTDVLAACVGYAEFLRHNPKRAAQDAHRWLAKRAWVGYLDTGRKAQQVQRKCEIVEGTDQWRAWEIYYTCCRASIPGISPLAKWGERRVTIIAEWPPVGRGLDPDRKNWVRVIQGSGQFAAWCRRLREGPANGIGLSRTCEDNGKWVSFLLVPQEWPPNKSDGTSEIDDDDAAAFANA